MRIKVIVVFMYPTGSGLSVGEHMSEGGDDVDGEANKKRSNGGVDWTKEWEDDGQEPYRDHHGQPSKRPQAYAFRVVHPDHLLPHEVERRARKSKCDELRKIQKQ